MPLPGMDGENADDALEEVVMGKRGELTSNITTLSSAHGTRTWQSCARAMWFLRKLRSKSDSSCLRPRICVVSI